MSEYYLEGYRKNGSIWILCGTDSITSIDKAREIAKSRIDVGDFEKVKIYTYEKKTIEEVDA